MSNIEKIINFSDIEEEIEINDKIKAIHTKDGILYNGILFTIEAFCEMLPKVKTIILK